MSHTTWLSCAGLLLSAACSVPDLTIQEQSVRVERDAAAADSDASAPPERDSGTDVSSAEGPRAGTGGSAGSSEPAAGSGGAGERAAMPVAGTSGPAAGSGGAAGMAAPEPRACLLWTSIDVRNGPPAGAIEGGFETITGLTTKQYICRIRPPGSMYAIPGKYVDRLGCYVVQRSGNEVNDTSVLDGSIDVLVPAPGCTFSWVAVTGGQVPPGAVDLGDPPDGRNFACRGDYSSFGASGTQVGTVVPSTDNPPVNQCWFESYANAIQPNDPAKFEVLVLDPV